MNPKLLLMPGGIWSNEVFRTIGVTLPITLAIMNVAYAKRPIQQISGNAVFFDLQYGFVTKPESVTKIQFGSLTPKQSSDTIPRADMLLGDGKEISDIARKISNRFPFMTNSEILSNYVGIYDVTPDWNPIVGRSAKISNLYHAVGMSGHGFKLAPVVGMIVADLILKGRSDLIPELFLRRKDSNQLSFPTNRLTAS